MHVEYTFSARGDDDRTYTILVMAPSEALSRALGQAAPAQRILRTLDGRLIDRTEPGSYVIPASGVNLRSDDERAP